MRLGAAALFLAAAAACGSDSPTAPTPGALTISAISPGTGSTGGGTTVSIVGSGFSGAVAVTFGGRPAASITVQGSVGITATTPPSSVAGAVDVVVTAGGRTATLTRGFTFVAPSGANQAPDITSIRSVGSRVNQPDGLADLDETLTLIARVTDVETPASALTYAWSGLGAFAGSGATVSWRAPATGVPTPAALTLTLTVTESYSEGGISHTNTASRPYLVGLHDSQKEILDMGEDFLALFSQSAVPTEQVLHNFSFTCDDGSGRAAEKRDVDRNRANQLTYTKYSIVRRPPVTFNFGGRCPFRSRKADACASFSVHWEFTRAGVPAVTDGVDYVTAVWENNRWYLCHSDFEGVERVPSLGIVRQVSW